ncbi:MAG TPA: hypothetical protein VMT94_04625 [Burkholderiales bacterium]|nr:hypothetical protein [Burkholderiales bacterium]
MDINGLMRKALNTKASLPSSPGFACTPLLVKIPMMMVPATHMPISFI